MITSVMCTFIYNIINLEYYIDLCLYIFNVVDFKVMNN